MNEKKIFFYNNDKFYSVNIPPEDNTEYYSRPSYIPLIISFLLMIFLFILNILFSKTEA